MKIYQTLLVASVAVGMAGVALRDGYLMNAAVIFALWAILTKE